MHKTKRLSTILLSVVFWAIALIHIYPILIILISSVKTKHEIAVNPFGIPREITYSYFAQAFVQMHYLRSLLNTALIAVVSVALLLIFASMAAYAIARRNTRFYNSVYMVFLAGLIVPFQMIMIPLYRMMLNFKLLNTYQGMAIYYLATLAPFSIFLLVGFVRTVPKELEEAALIDGCGIYQNFFRIVFPLLKPSLTTVGVLNLFNIWNDFLAPMLYLQKSQMMTLTVQLSSFRGMYFNDWSLIFTGVCLIVFPMLIIYIAAQNLIINGITAGAVKG
jgi:raffinose/stachyose/melibiose transport system permease protein